MKTINLKKVQLMVLMTLLPAVTFAQDALDTSSKIQTTIQWIANIGGSLTVIILLIIAGFKYAAAKPSQGQPGQGAADELKSRIIHIVVGGGIILGAANIGIEIWKMLGGN